MQRVLVHNDVNGLNNYLNLLLPHFCLMEYLAQLFNVREWWGRAPLSPLIFALADDVLQSLVNEEIINGLLTMPLALQCSPTFPTFQYAYDTLVILQSDVQ